MKKRNLVLGVAAALALAAVVGAKSSVLPASWNPGAPQGAVAQAPRAERAVPVDVAVLERLSVNDAQEAARILKVSLQGSMLAVDANRARLTDTQRAQVAAIEARLSRFREKDK